MQDSVVHHTTQRRINLLRVIPGIIGIIVVLVFIVIHSGPYWYAKFTQNPNEPIENAVLYELTEADTIQYFRTVKGLATLERSIYETEAGFIIEPEAPEADETNTNTTTDAEATPASPSDEQSTVVVTAYYHIIILDGLNLLLVRTDDPDGNAANRYTGALLPVPEAIIPPVLEILGDTQWNQNNLQVVMVDAIDNVAGWYSGTLFLIALTLFSIWSIQVGLTSPVEFEREREREQERERRTKPPKKQPKSNDTSEPQTVIGTIEQELADQSDSIGDITLTKNYVVYATDNTFEAVKYDDILWVYRRNQKNSNKTTVYVRDKNGTILDFEATKRDAEIAMAGIISRVPWALLGYIPDIQEAWDNDRDFLVEMVADRRQRILEEEASA